MILMVEWQKGYLAWKKALCSTNLQKFSSQTGKRGGPKGELAEQRSPGKRSLNGISYSQLSDGHEIREKAGSVCPLMSDFRNASTSLALVADSLLFYNSDKNHTNMTVLLERTVLQGHISLDLGS